MRKAQFQVSFAWLFAIIVGAFILFLAIYAATKVINTGQEATSAQTGKEISVLLNPLETGFETGKTTLLTMPVETRINNKCNPSGTFGRQSIQISQKSFNKWAETEIDVGFSNKYIFSDGITEGKNFYLFSRVFEFPFKVADTIYLTSSKKNYCFSDAPERIEDELEDINQKNLFTGNCPKDSIDICFEKTGCDINVNDKQKSVKKRDYEIYYETDALMFAAIFSDKDIYECQVERLMQRTNELALLYNEKSNLIAKQGCLSEVNVLSLVNAVKKVRSSEDLIFVRSVVKDIERDNLLAECRLW